MNLTRRDLSKLALGTAFAAHSAPAQAFFHDRWTPESVAERLAADLNAALRPECDGSFSVSQIAVQDAPFSIIDAAIQLDWPPGLRRRPFLGIGDDNAMAYDKVLAAARAYFEKVWRMPDGAGCFL